ncbi:MAG: hypothetical protein AAFR23_09360 [Pseudomonadota bacterium]
MVSTKPRFAIPLTLRGRNAVARTALVALAALAVGSAAAPTSVSADGRYTMSPSGEGFVRLDTKTGEMAFCTKSATAWTCTEMDDPAKTLREENARLKKENNALQSEIAKLDQNKLDDPNSQSDDPPARPAFPKLKLPTEKEVDQALSYFERMMKKFRDTMQELRDGTGESRKGALPEGDTAPGADGSRPL